MYHKRLDNGKGRGLPDLILHAEAGDDAGEESEGCGGRVGRWRRGWYVPDDYRESVPIVVRYN